MKRTAVESSMIRSVGYDPVKETLEIEFNSGGVYQYAEVTEEIYRELMAAESKGRYMHEYILDQYPYGRVRNSRR